MPSLETDAAVAPMRFDCFSVEICVGVGVTLIGVATNVGGVGVGVGVVFVDF